MKEVKDVVAMIIDEALFMEFAVKLAEEFKTVYYFNEWHEAFPSYEKYIMGSNLPGVIMTPELYHKNFEDVDIFIFPDVYKVDLQRHLRSIGKIVWGMGDSEYYETDRWKFKEKLIDLELPVLETHFINGIEELKIFLKKVPKAYVKITDFRGNLETFKHFNYLLTCDYLEVKAKSLKINKGHDIDFIVELPLDDAVEIGYDGWTINGQFPSKAGWGYEVKGIGYIGVIQDYKDMPWQIQEVNNRWSDVYKKNKSCGNFSTEIRIDKSNGIPYYTDFCSRLGSPPSEAYFEAYKNWGEIIWKGAHCQVIDPISTTRFVCESMLYSTWVEHDITRVIFPEKYRKWIKFRNFTITKDNEYMVLPTGKGNTRLGSVVGHGDTLEDAIDMMLKISKTVEFLEPEVTSVFTEEALGNIKEGNKCGLKFPIK
jgi:hypothetical protein